MNYQRIIYTEILVFKKSFYLYLNNKQGYDKFKKILSILFLGNSILIKKPSIYFYVLILICFLSLILIGNPSWRHVDDYGPLLSLDNAKSFNEYYKLFTWWGWGSYPPIWQYFTFFSYIFKPLGIDFLRFSCFFYGFLSLSFSSFLTYTICIYLKNINLEGKKNFKHFYRIELLSIFINCLNPEVFLHSNSNLPYNLGTITIQLSIILLLTIVENDQLKSDYSNLDKSEFIILNQKSFYLLVIFSIILTFQSIIIIISSLITLIFYKYKKRENFNLIKFINIYFLCKKYYSLFNFLNNKILRNLIFFTLSFLFFIYIFKIFLMIFYFNMEPGSWANGINNIYKISLFKIKPLINFLRIFSNTNAIIGQSLYPIVISKYSHSILISLIYLISILHIKNKNNLRNYFLYFSSFIFLITIIFSLLDYFVYAPTRHTIFIYPLIWIPTILLINNFLERIGNTFFNILFISLISILYFHGAYNSINKISYSAFDNQKIIEFLTKSDIYLSKSYEPFSNIFMNGSKEYFLTNKKNCELSDNEKLKNKKFLVFSHRLPFTSNKEQLNYLYKNNKKCFSKETSFKIVEKYEKFNNGGIEQNIFIKNGDSNLFLYILEKDSDK